jgi:hypothetical protein
LRLASLVGALAPAAAAAASKQGWSRLLGTTLAPDATATT